MSASLDSILIECLDALEKGESIDRTLARYPQEAAQLRPALETAVRLANLNVQPSLAAQTRSRDAFLTQAAALKDDGKRRPSPWLNLRRILMPIVSLAAIIFIFAVGLIPLSASSLPGDPLYGAKLFIEETQLVFTTNPSAQSELNEQFDQRRIQEIAALLAAGKNAQVSFDGLIEEIQPEVWTIAGLPVQIAPETQILGGNPFVGQLAMVDGRTQSGRLIAETILLPPETETVPPTPTATVTATSTTVASETPTATPEQMTATPTATSSPTATSTATTTATATATLEPSPTTTATATPEPSPTPTLIPDDNDNDNDDNGNDNDDDNDNSDNGDDDNATATVIATLEPSPTAIATATPEPSPTLIPGDNDNDNDGDNDNDNDDNSNDNDDDNANDNGGS